MIGSSRQIRKVDCVLQETDLVRLPCRYPLCRSAGIGDEPCGERIVELDLTSNGAVCQTVNNYFKAISGRRPNPIKVSFDWVFRGEVGGMICNLAAGTSSREQSEIANWFV
jgi:hypothetical protein